MIFHFNWQNYFKLLRLAWNENNPKVRGWFLVILLLWVPPVATFHAICFFLDGIFFPGLWRTKIVKPVFVIGHARSGTTLMHRLLSQDQERFSSFMLYEMYFPSLLQKWLIRKLAMLDRKCGGPIEKRIQAWDDRHYAAMRKVHDMGLLHLEEDDIVLYYSLASGFWITKMPYMGEIDFYSVDQWPAKKRKRLMRFYRDCLRRQLYLNGADKTHLSKNPVFSGRVEALLETFPDARIVVPVRNPYETIPSLLKLMRGGWKRLGWDEERQARCLAFLANQSFYTYRHPLEVLASRPDVPHSIVDYRDLIADPATTIETVYRDLGLDMSDATRETLLGEGKRARNHKTDHRYSLEEFGLKADSIRAELPELFERFGWDT
ncbi:MAG: sulfotransferase [Deltaproteobacteria bacterium]